MSAVPVGRLLRRSQFLAVAGARRKWVAPGLILQVRKHDDRQRPAAGEPSIRVGYTASKKVGNAVVRNRCRRRLRAVVAELLPGGAAGYDLVVIARAETAIRPYDSLKQDLTAGLRRLGVWPPAERRPPAGDAAPVAASGGPGAAVSS